MGPYNVGGSEGGQRRDMIRLMRGSERGVVGSELE